MPKNEFGKLLHTSKKLDTQNVEKRLTAVIHEL